MLLSTKEKIANQWRCKYYHATVRNTTILSVTVTWLTFQSSISFVTVIFLIMPKARRSSYTMAFRIKVVAEAKAVENSSEIAKDYGLSESIVRRWRRDQATILSGKLKMSERRAKMSRFTPKCPELDEQARSGFYGRETKYLTCTVKWEELLPNRVRSSFNAWEAKNRSAYRWRNTVIVSVVAHIKLYSVLAGKQSVLLWE